MNENTVSDLSLLSGLTELGWVRANDNLAAEIPPLCAYYSSLVGDPVTTVEGAQDCPGLRTLFVPGSQIQSIDVLGGHPALQGLAFSSTAVTDISALSTLSISSICRSTSRRSRISPSSASSRSSDRSTPRTSTSASYRRSSRPDL